MITTPINCSFHIPVLLPYPFKGPFYYNVPPQWQNKLTPGKLVIVPLNKREELGVVWQSNPLPIGIIPPKISSPSLSNLKTILSIPDLPSLPIELLQFIDWVAAYTLSPPGSVLAMALRSINTSDSKSHHATGWIKPSSLPEKLRLTPKRKKVLEALSSINPYTTRYLIEQTGVSAQVIQGLAKIGVIQSIPLSVFQTANPDFTIPILSAEQQKVAQALCDKVQSKQFSVTLLQGITGSGKTEVYMQAIAACLKLGQQVLVLLPEIALSSQWVDRFVRRFGHKPALWHSDLTPKSRHLTWQAIINSEVQVVVGARSALFLPFVKLGLIIVDEEHDSSFKQEEGVIYNARDMAIVRAQLSQSTAILVSATPSLETLVNVQKERYQKLTLTQRHGGASLPTVETIDLRIHPPSRGLFLSPVLIENLKETLNKGEQAMLFLNRRGYAPLTLCRACGYRIECPHCSAWLVEHRSTQRLVCHHCGYLQDIPEHCPHCSAEKSFVPIGPGVERITEEARAIIPDAKILVMASDSLTTTKATREAIGQIESQQVNLIIGTQVVAKGWHFPYLTLVGVVDADLGLTGADLRAAEHTLQLLHQVGGRAGRAEALGKVILQSYMPQHPVIQALVKGDIDDFMEQEALERQPGFWPPYGRLVAIIVSANTNEEASKTAHELGKNSPQIDGIVILGPTPAPLALLRNRYRYRLLLRARRNIPVQPILRKWLATIKLTKHIKIGVDIDPISFL